VPVAGFFPIPIPGANIAAIIFAFLLQPFGYLRRLKPNDNA